MQLYSDSIAIATAIAYRASLLYLTRISLRGCKMSDRSLRTASGQILARPIIDVPTSLQTAQDQRLSPLVHKLYDIGPAEWKTSAGTCFLPFAFLGLLYPLLERAFLCRWAIVGSSSRPILACRRRGFRSMSCSLALGPCRMQVAVNKVQALPQPCHCRLVIERSNT